MKLAYPAFALAKASAKGKCCERRRRSRAQCLSACTGVVDLQKENNIVKSMMKVEAYRNMLWNEHIEYKALMFSVIVDNEYAGYCGIKNTAHEQWEIAIEILNKWKHKGIGYRAISVMLDEIKNRLNVSEFRVRIDAENYPSQRLFEKLGAAQWYFRIFVA